MYYVTIDNKIGKSSNPPKNSKEIHKEKYLEIVSAKSKGDGVTIENGDVVTYTPPVYSPNGEERKERDPEEPMITKAPPKELYVPEWDGEQWIEAETDSQRKAREKEEKQAERDRINAITVTRFQAKVALDEAGLLDQVESYIRGDDVPRRIKLAWEEGSFKRGSSMIKQIAKEMGLSQNKVDELFFSAREIE